MSNELPRVVVVGGGIAGLVAARSLQTDHAVTIVEAGDRLGGKIATTTFRDRPLDLGADAFITRNPAAMQLCAELGIDDQLVEPSASSAAIYARGRLYPFPSGLVFGIPTDLRALRKSHIIGTFGVLNVFRDLFSIRQVLPDDIAATVYDGSYDPSVSEILEPRFGRHIVEHLIDPLIGGINASDVRQLSFYATMPQIAEQLRSTRSVIRRLKTTRSSTRSNVPSIFRGLTDGMAQMVDAIEHDLRVGGTSIVLGESVQDIAKQSTTRFTVSTVNQLIDADFVVLATPAYVSAELVASRSSQLADELAAIPYASVATITFAWPFNAMGKSIGRQLQTLIGRRSPNTSPSPSEHVLPGSGALVARNSFTMITAATFTSTKWPRSASPDEIVIRASVGRHGDDRLVSLRDDELIARVQDELTEICNIHGEPLDVQLQRWPRSFPQYVRGHTARVGRITHLATLLGIELAGAAYDGIGIPACIASGNGAAERVRAQSAN